MTLAERIRDLERAIREAEALGRDALAFRLRERLEVLVEQRLAA